MSEILITGGRLIDGSGAAPRPADVLLRDDDIVAVGAPGTVQASQANPRHLDATAKTVMPGLIDTHLHCTFDDVQSNDELFFHRDPAMAALTTAQNLNKILRAGVTSFMDPDTAFGIGPSVRDAIEFGVITGPRMKTGYQALLTAVGGTAGRLIPDDGRAGYAQVVNSVDEVILWTRRHIKYGADWIKIHATGSIPGRSGELLVWSRDELKAACDAAHELGVPVTAHCRSDESTRAAVEAGVDLILHASFITEATVQALVDHRTPVCPTFTFLANLADYGPAVDAGVGQYELFRGEIEATAAMMRAAYDAGVPLLCGSESGFALTPYGHWHGREMEVFVNELGLTPLEAITCGTANGAIAMRMQGQIGTIEVGRRADVLVVDGDPSVDITILNDKSRFAHIISRGVEVDLSAPWPEHRRLPGSKVANWATASLTYERAQQYRERRGSTR
jgi:imidazolonepropionase-like amidohydrolase